MAATVNGRFWLFWRIPEPRAGPRGSPSADVNSASTGSQIIPELERGRCAVYCHGLLRTTAVLTNSVEVRELFRAAVRAGAWALSHQTTPAEAMGREQTTQERLAAVTIGAPEPLNGSIQLAPYDPDWPLKFASLAARIRQALADRVVLLEHAGSTSVEHLSAKPIIDMVLAIADSSDESAYVPLLESHGFRLRIREPAWFEHRLLKFADPEANLHVFSAGCAEIDRMLAFRDRLRTHEGDRRLYEESKVALAARSWEYVQDYADAKSDIIRAILARAGRGAGTGTPA